MKALAIEIDEDEIKACYYCGRKETFKKAIDRGWGIYVFHERHECNKCKDIPYQNLEAIRRE